MSGKYLQTLSVSLSLSADSSDARSSVDAVGLLDDFFYNKHSIDVMGNAAVLVTPSCDKVRQFLHQESTTTNEIFRLNTSYLKF